MIPEGREAVDAAGAAAILAIAQQTFRNKRITSQPGFPRPFRPGARKPLWDRGQVEAYAAGQVSPALPEEERPGDLLDAVEAAELLGITYATLKRYVHTDGRLPPDVEVCGVPHWRRDKLAHRRDNPGRPGRPRRALTA